MGVEFVARAGPKAIIVLLLVNPQGSTHELATAGTVELNSRPTSFPFRQCELGSQSRLLGERREPDQAPPSPDVSLRTRAVVTFSPCILLTFGLCRLDGASFERRSFDSSLGQSHHDLPHAPGRLTTHHPRWA